MSAEIYLDMDGVCVDFMGAAIKANGFPPDESLARWLEEHPGSLFPEAIFERSPMAFFTHEYIQTEEFWANLTPFDWFDDLYAELNRLGHVVFLTAPTGSPGCVSGKHHWLIERFGTDFHDFIFTRHKNRLAHNNAYLIDDMAFNTEPFSERDGHGILFPQIWNELNHVDNPVPHVITELEKKLAR
ncbi:MAG: hypothetical protein JJ921_11035 [Pseudomonadales bacterium]|nr:hypothetical protein [Pseudomonadales bacterium]MBO7005289.1 hypothetical protein [Pseudomonadales bacterium]